MNRREALQKITTALAATGISASVKAIDAEPRPLLFVLTVDNNTSVSAHDRKTMACMWQDLWEGKPPAPLIILGPGQDLHVMIRPDDSLSV